MHRWIVWAYATLGKKNYYLRSHKDCANKKWFKRYLELRHITKLENSGKFWCSQYFNGYNHHLSYDEVDHFFSIQKENKILKKIKQLFVDDNIELIFKRGLNNSLARFYYLNMLFHNIETYFPETKILFVPSNGIERLRTKGCEAYEYHHFLKQAFKTNAVIFEAERTTFPQWAFILSYLKMVRGKIGAHFNIFGILFFICLNKILAIFQGPLLKHHYKYAMMILAPERQFANKIQKVDFLIDHSLIKREETVFFSYKRLSKKNKTYLKAHNLNYTDNLDAWIHWTTLIKILPFYLKLFCSLREDTRVLDTSVKVIYSYLKWEGALKKIQMDTLISYGSDVGIQAVSRNILLRKNKCKTHYYADTSSFDYVYRKKDSKLKFRDGLYGFIYYDTILTWSEDASNYFLDLKGNIEKRIQIGCLWSSHIKLIHEGKIQSNLKKRLYQQGYHDALKIVSVFDSGFNDYLIITAEDGVRFLEGILKLLKNLPQIFVILKEKKPRSLHQKITVSANALLQLYGSLEKDPRCYGLREWENSSEIIALSDLTISFPFTSPTFEALSARQKALWFDATSKFKNTFYDHIPGLVCHSYEELSIRVKELLFDTKENQYNLYLDKFIKGKIEPYLDGKALNRFRELLIGNEFKK